MTKLVVICMHALGLDKEALPEGTTFTEKCDHCGETVALAPTSQRVIAGRPKTEYGLICQYCYVPSQNDAYALAPGLQEELTALHLRNNETERTPIMTILEGFRDAAKAAVALEDDDDDDRPKPPRRTRHRKPS